MAGSPMLDSFRDKCLPRRPHPSPITVLGCELATISLKVAEDSPLNHKAKQSQSTMRGSARFGAPSHSPFFCRNNPHSQRVHHIRGINERPICAVNDITFGQVPQYCLGRVLTPEKYLVLQCKIPTSAIGTNNTYLPTDVITGLQFFPLKMVDSPSLRLLTETWRAELQEWTERTGLLGPPGKGSSVPSSPQPHGSASVLAGSRDEERTLKLQLMVIDTLCQILQTESIGEVQQWMLTAGQREKDQVLSLLCAALTKDPVSTIKTPDVEELTMREAHGQPMGSRMASISEEEPTRDQSSEPMSNSNNMVDAESDRPKTRTPREKPNTRPRTTPRTLGSPTVCHLNQKVVLRYTKRSLTPQIPLDVYQAEWPNYTQHSPGSVLTVRDH